MMNNKGLAVALFLVCLATCFTYTHSMARCVTSWNPKWRNASQLLMMKEEHACRRYTMLFGPENILSFLWSQIVVNLFKSLINIVPQLCLRASKTRLYIIFWRNIVLKYLNLTCFHHRLQSHHHYHHQNHVQENYNVPLIQIVVVVVITY